jgi:hypothetical protein
MTSAAAPMPTEITGAELAMLGLSNPPEISWNAAAPIAVTTKESYLWAILLGNLAEIRIQPAQLINTLTEEMRKEKLAQMAPNSGVAAESAHGAVLKRVAEQLLSPRPDDIDAWFEGLKENANRTYRELLSKGLIEDPFSIILAGAVVTVLGLTPVSFTRQTQAGQQVLTRISAAFYRYERSRKDQDETVNIRFNLFALIRAFSTAASSGFTKAWQSLQGMDDFDKLDSK